MASVALVVIYCLIGYVLAIPYCFLAGWSQNDYPAVVMFLPGFLLVWVGSAIVAGVIEPVSAKIRFNWRAAFRKGWRVLTFWLWTFYCLLPISLHISSVILKKVGFSTIAEKVYQHRYGSTFYVPLVIIMAVCFIAVVSAMWDEMKTAWKKITHKEA